MECSPWLDGEKALIWGILYQALHDVLTGIGSPATAIRFIKGASPDDVWLFNFYAGLLDIDAEWLREKMLKCIAKRQHELLLRRSLAEFEVQNSAIQITREVFYDGRKRKKRSKSVEA